MKGRMKMNLEHLIIDSVEDLQEVLRKVRNAQKEYAKFSQEQIDNIVQHLRKKSIAGEEFPEGYVREKRPNIKLPPPDTSPETIQQMQNEITYLKQEIEFLKKVSDQGRAP